ADQVPGLQLLDRGRHVGARQPEQVGDLLRGQRPLGPIEQRVDLADRAIDAPLVARVAPLPAEALGCPRPGSGSVRKFCHDRNYRPYWIVSQAEMARK